MKKTVALPALVILAIASLTAASSARQAPPTARPAGDDGKREYTISGCLLRSGYAGYQIEDAHLDAIDGKPVAEPPPASSSGNSITPKKWILEGGGNLGARTGEKVQVIGRSEWQPPSSSAAADEPPNRTPHLDVKSVKSIASSCS